MKKNGILTFLFAFVPGAGQMYQGYMKRGLSLITLFFLCIMAGMLLLEQLVLTALIVWMYSFFDTFNLRAQFIAGTAPADDYLVHFNTKDARLTLFFRDSHKLVGWALIALGCNGGLPEHHHAGAGGCDVALGPEQPLLPRGLSDAG